MTSARENPHAETMELRAPVIAMVLAATAIPIELRAPTYQASDFILSAGLAADVLANIIGYVPVGIVLRDFGPLRAVMIASAMAILAETAQLVMAHRDPAIHDALSNIVGAMIGVAIAYRWQVGLPAFVVTRRKSQIAALMAALIVGVMWLSPAEAPSARGFSLPGTLEAHWKLDQGSGRTARDWSGHGLDGKFSREPNIIDGAIQFDGAADHVDIGRPAAIRLVGSMTISAWIKPTSFPVDDAAVVSSFTAASAGYQLDSTIDEGPRTISFKIANECGQLAARYGVTPLVADISYHIAGVYNAEARALDVYLNGKLDNGLLLGSVTGRQHSSRSTVYIGRRSDWAGFEFAGAIRDVRIYSRALDAAEIASIMQGNVADASTPNAETSRSAPPQREKYIPTSCSVVSDAEDKHLPIFAAGVGLLAAVAALGLLPGHGRLLWLLASLAAGVLLISSTLPPINFWLVPLTSLFGGASAVISLRRHA